MKMDSILDKLGINKVNEGASTGTKWHKAGGEHIKCYSPVDGKHIATAVGVDRKTYDKVIAKAEEAFTEWRMWPAPKRGEVVRQIAEALRSASPALL